LREAARNEGGAAGIGVGVGAGMGLGHSMAETMTANNSNSSDSASNSAVDKLTQLKKMLDAELISQEDYDTKKKLS
jgi:membrane protease subunit (stomatin/prohibitin family)